MADFQQKRTAGLGALFGPIDAVLDECIHDKNKELKVVEQILVPKMEPFMWVQVVEYCKISIERMNMWFLYYSEEIEKDVVDDRKFTTAAALGTILSKIFGIRGQHFNSLLERCPTFVSKEKSFKARLIGRSRKVRCTTLVVRYWCYRVARIDQFLGMFNENVFVNGDFQGRAGTRASKFMKLTDIYETCVSNVNIKCEILRSRFWKKKFAFIVILSIWWWFRWFSHGKWAILKFRKFVGKIQSTGCPELNDPTSP